MKKDNKSIYVTRPMLPPIERFTEYLEDIWESKWLTNNAKYHQLFENALGDYLDIEHCSLFANGTLALIIALQSLRITGEVITTPYSFVATTHSLHWNGIRPVFCDIGENSFNIDADKIESLITSKTTAILPVHVYGTPCNTVKIQKLADIYGLKVIYDAAHAFGVTVNGDTILREGDISILSFHATKVFHTFEGGAIITRDKKLKKRIDFLKNFGFADETTVVAFGINAKMNEFQAACGLLQLEYIDEEIRKRKEIAKIYRQKLSNIKGIRYVGDLPQVKHNYSYFPVLICQQEFGKSRDNVYAYLKKHNIYSRRYFFPLISQFPIYRNLPSANVENLPVANKIAREILCLPIYGDLTEDEVNNICELMTYHL